MQKDSLLTEILKTLNETGGHEVQYIFNIGGVLIEVRARKVEERNGPEDT